MHDSFFFKLNKKYPPVTLFQRLEPSPYSEKFERNLNVEVRDAHWMLFRQWQIGEFIGEDAGRAWKIQVSASHRQMDYLNTHNGGNERKIGSEQPLEALVETEPLYADLHLRLKLGNLFKSLLREYGLLDYFSKFLIKYAISSLEPEEFKNDTEAKLLFEAVKDISLDGYKILSELPSNDNWVEELSIDINDKTVIDEYLKAVVDNFLLQANNIYPIVKKLSEEIKHLSKENPFWHTDQLEYQFKLAESASQKDQNTGLTVNNYSEGSLEWYHFDVEKKDTDSHPKKKAFIPAPMQLKAGTPGNWWEFENGSFNLAKILVKDTGVLDLLFIEFAVSQTNDWILVPYAMNINTLCRIEGVVVTDVFGIKYLVFPSNQSPENQYGWSIFSLKGADEQTFYLAPTVVKSQESPPLEKISIMRDEAANLVWAIQEIVPNQLGKGKSGYESALAANPLAGTEVNQDNKMKYTLGTTVPSNWTPFIPVSLDNPNQKEIILQRSKMPDTPNGHKAQGIILNENTTPLICPDKTESNGYFIREEAIPRSGLQLTRHYQRARWINGDVVTWIGRKKKVGRGEGSSGLVFDQLKY